MMKWTKCAIRFLRISRPGVRVPSIAPRKTRTHSCSGFSFCLHSGRDSNRAAAHSAASKATVRLCLARGSQRLGMSTVEAVDRKISWLFCFSGRVCTLLHISCTLYKKAMNSLHRLHSVYFAAQKLSLSGRGPSILLTQDRSVAQKPHWGFHCCAALANANFPSMCLEKVSPYFPAFFSRN